MSTLINVNQILTEEEERFCQDVALGKGYKDSFIKHFPERASACRNVTSAAYSMIQKVHIATHIKDLVEARRKCSIQSMNWTREQATETLNYVINVCQNDIEKVQRARQEELTFLADCLNDEEKTKQEIEGIVQKMLNIQKKSSINKVQIAGIIDAVAELNSMYGYNEHNVNVNSPVTFVGEAQLED